MRTGRSGQFRSLCSFAKQEERGNSRGGKKMVRNPRGGGGALLLAHPKFELKAIGQI